MATAALTAATTVLGVLPWPRPVLAGTTESSYVISGVSGAMWALTIGSATLCLTVASMLILRMTGLRPWRPIALAWGGLVLLAAAALVWKALWSAAYSQMQFGAVIPILDWLYAFVPAVAAGVLFAQRGRRFQVAAALGTAVVTVPLFHLAAVLLVADDPVAAAVAAVPATGIFAVLPIVGAVALTRGRVDHGVDEVSG